MTTARDIIEACAKLVDGNSRACVPGGIAQKMMQANADAIRALADQYGDAILCEPEVACVLTTSKEIHTPLYRAKELTK
jgi:hypothetical protein